MRHPLSVVSLALMLSACGSGPEVSFSEINPEIAVAPPDLLTFLPVVVAETGFADLYVTNAGDAPLDLEWTLDDPDGVFGFEADPPTEILKEESALIRVTFTPPNFLDYTGEITIVHNDPDTDPLSVAIIGTGVDAPKPDICIEETVIDFGEVAQDDTEIRFFEIGNCGSAPLELGTLDLNGSGAFGVESNPTFTTIAANNELPVILTYEPYADQGDNGTLVIPSNDPDEPEVIVTLLGNGGGDLEYPEAVVDCPGIGNPPGYVTLDGSESFDPSELYPLEFEWSLIAVPFFSNEAQFTNPGAEITDLYMDAAGDYAAQLIVYNSAGIPSAPALCPIFGQPADAIHVELTWDTPSADLDLHLIENDGALFELPTDCTWCNRTPDWAGPTGSDDPRLDLDDLGGYGPENINVFEPAEGRYHVKVHYYDDNGDFAVQASVKVWLNGAVEWEGSKVLTRNQAWDTGQINWPEGTFAPDPAPPYEAPTRTCYTP